MRRPIVVDYIHPPIPNRNFDFQAYFDDAGPEVAALIGWGSTPEEAVQALIEAEGAYDELL